MHWGRLRLWMLLQVAAPFSRCGFWLSNENALVFSYQVWVAPGGHPGRGVVNRPANINREKGKGVNS
jgi:hypothetical protein